MNGKIEVCIVLVYSGPDKFRFLISKAQQRAQIICGHHTGCTRAHWQAAKQIETDNIRRTSA